MQKTSTYKLIKLLARVDQSKGWTQALRLLESVKIYPTKLIKDIDLKRIKAKPKECYMNALAVCLENPEVHYVEGYIEVHGVPIDHAWNCYRGKHFDVTEETLDKQMELPHRSIMIISGDRVRKLALEYKVSGPYFHHWIQKQKRNEKVASKTMG